MADITQLRYAQLLKAALGLKAIDPAQHTAGLLNATFEVQDQYRPELRWNRGERMFGVAAQASNSVAGFGAQELVNPTGSGKLVVVERIRVSGGTPTNAIQPGSSQISVLGPSTPTANAATGSVPRDSRINPVPNSGLVSFNNNGATLGVFTYPTGGQRTFAWQPFVTAANNVVDLTIPIDMTLAPNSACVVVWESTVLPTGTYSFLVHWSGYERFLDPAELIGAP